MNISENNFNIILSTKQNLLIWNGEAWVKKNGGNCDVTMGSWDGAESSDLIGLYMLFPLKDFGVNLGLYRDDGLGVLNKRPQQVERIKKQICQKFRENGLKSQYKQI